MSDLRSGGGLTGMMELLARFMAEQGSLGILAKLELESRWEELVGKQLSRQCWPESVAEGKLTIAVPSATWNQTLRAMERRLLTAIQQRCPELGINSIRITVAPRPKPKPKPAELPVPTPHELAGIPVLASAQEAIDAAAAEVEDDELRERMIRIMVGQQQLKQWRLAHGWRTDPATGEWVAPRPGRRP